MRGVTTALLILAASGFAADQHPVKLDIEAAWQNLRAGDQVPLRIRLLNAENVAVQAPKHLIIQLQARLSSGEVKPLRSVSMEQNESVKEVAISPPGTGMVYIWAKQPELLPGGVFVAVRASGSVAAKPPLSTSLFPHFPKGTPPPGGVSSVPQPVPVPPAPGVPRLALRYSPDRRFLADGQDAATVQAFLLNDFNTADIRLNLFDSSGTMKPTPLTIPKGQESGQAVVTFNQPGTVTVEFMSSEPSAVIDGDRKLAISFMPAITHVALEASPPGISLVDKSDVLVSFRDLHERPVASDVARHVSFAIATGRGDLAQKEIDIGAGQFEARTAFQPSWLGRTEIAVSSPNLLTVSVPVQVSAPLGLLLCSLAGGLAGGYLAYRKRKRSGRRQIGIGAVTGFLFYWACLFLGLAAVGHAAAVNPLSAFALSTFGGWMQTGVFSFWKSRLKPYSAPGR